MMKLSKESIAALITSIGSFIISYLGGLRFVILLMDLILGNYVPMIHSAGDYMRAMYLPEWISGFDILIINIFSLCIAVFGGITAIVLSVAVWQKQQKIIAILSFIFSIFALIPPAMCITSIIIGIGLFIFGFLGLMYFASGLWA